MSEKQEREHSHDRDKERTPKLMWKKTLRKKPTWTPNEIITNSTQKRLGKLNFAITFNTNYINLECTTVCLCAACTTYICTLTIRAVADAHKFLQNIHMPKHYAR